MNDYIPIHICDDVVRPQMILQQNIDQEFKNESREISHVVDMDNHIPIHICDDVVQQDIPFDQMIDRVFRRRALELNMPISELIQRQYR
jgi:hypothetical protein